MPRKSRIGNMRKTGGSFSTRLVLSAIAIFLSFIGLIFVFEASSIRALQSHGDSFYYLKLQARWVVLGIIALIFFSLLNYRILFSLSTPALIGIVVLLILVLTPLGTVAGGSGRWVNLGFINIQPAEFSKLALVMYLSSWFSKKSKSRFLPFLAIMGGIMGLIILQPDMGTTIMVFFLCISMYAISGQKLRYLLALIPIVISGFIFLIVSAPYRLRRLAAFLDPSEDPMGVGFHINQILISLSEGGIFGRGFGASRQKYLFLPEAHTDSIFAIIGEELGFVGAFLLISTFFVFLYKLYSLSISVSDRYGKLLVSGVFVYFTLQILINLGGMVNIIPLTGVTLPFISYGGSSMLTSFAMLGIALSVSRYTTKKT